MQAVRIVTDSVADIPPDLARKYGIRVVPAYVHFGIRTYRDGVDLTPEEFYSRLASEKELPKTSQPSPGDFYEAYAEIVETGASIVSIHPSAELTGTYSSACLARASLPSADIEVIDTRYATMAEGLLAIEAARAARMGLPKAEIVKMIRALAERVRFFVSLDSLDFIGRSGRVGKAKVFLASMLNIKPIITVRNGVIEPLDRVRGAARVIPRLMEMCQETVKSARVRASVIHAQALNYATRLKDEVEKRLHTRVIVADAGPAIVSNAGPGSYGLAIIELPDDHPVQDLQ